MTSTVKNSHQDGDFKLEERIQAMKRMAPKGMVTKETWTRISRSLDDVDLAVRHGMRLLTTLTVTLASLLTSLTKLLPGELTYETPNI